MTSYLNIFNRVVDMATFANGGNTTLPDEFLEDEHFIDLESANNLNNGNVWQNKYCQPVNSVSDSPVEPCEGTVIEELE